jgi:ubiquinone/menaquinone biosynthesis C-methylase UbiE
MNLASFIHASSQPAGRGMTIGTPRVYEAYAAMLFRGRRRAAFRTLLEASEVRPGDRVLDVGSGTGFFARMLAKVVAPEGMVIGLDAAPEMVAYANRKARGIHNCRFQTGSAESLPHPSDHFDVVVSSFVMHHLPEDLRLPALGEMRRVLRPGGKIVVAEVPTSVDMRHGVPPLEGLLEEAGFTEIRSGEVRPWTQYARASVA